MRYLHFACNPSDNNVLKAIEAILKDKIYNETLVQGWVDEICSRLTKELVEMNKPFKYIGRITISSLPIYYDLVSCTIMQKNGTGLHSANACHWDISNDSCVSVRWPTEKRKDPNARVVCIVTVYGLDF